MNIINISTTKKSEYIEITDKVRNLISKEVKNGICNIFTFHTTAGVMINENADFDVLTDIDGFLDNNVPWNNRKYKHIEGNTAAHIKSIFTGVSTTIPIKDGKLMLGRWQGVYFCEFDGPRPQRNIAITIIESKNNF